MREAGRSRFEGGARIVLKRCKRKKAATEGGKRERKINDGTERREDVDMVIVAEIENRREGKEGRERGEGGTQTM